VTPVTEASKRKTAKPAAAGGKDRAVRTPKRRSAEDEALELAKARERARQRSGSDD
jgi:hypothetical protein